MLARTSSILLLLRLLLGLGGGGALRLEVPLRRGHAYDVQWNGTHVSMRDVDDGHLVLVAVLPPACQGRPLDARVVGEVLRLDVPCVGDRRVPRRTPPRKEAGAVR